MLIKQRNYRHTDNGKPALSGRIAGFVCLVVLAIAALRGPLAAQAAGPAGGESFFDDFDGFEQSRWQVSDGWVNGDWQNCTWSRQAVTSGDGLLNLHFRRQKNDRRSYICAEIQSREKYGYGAYEIRLRTQKGSGLNAAFFTYTGASQGTVHDEIDVELLLRDTGRVSVNTYVSGRPENGATLDLAHASDAGFTQFAFVWGPDGIDWYVDNRRVHATAGSRALPSTAQKIFASFWGSDTFSDWMGPFADPGGDLVVQIDWIAYTRRGEGCQFAQSVLCAGD